MCHALIDDVHAELCQAVDVRFAASEVPSFDRVVEEAINAVAVVLIILGGIDAALSGDAVCAPGTVLETEALHVVAQLGQRRRSRRTGKARSDDNNVVLPLVRRIHQLHFEPMPVPSIFNRPRRYPGIQFHCYYLTSPVRTARGTETNPAMRSHEKTAANVLIIGVYLG